MSKLVWLLYAFGSLLLWIYSYGFLDYNLTLSSSPHFLNFVQPLQDLVYFHRPLSSQVYSVILSFLFLLYLFVLFRASSTETTVFPWRPILIVILILTLSYPMLSYDVFNYMFHGKILWLYHMNPHLHAPLAFEGDLWLRFMRWVHTPSAYGPVFTLIESPAYLLGIGKFVPVLYLMKITMSAFFVWCIYLVGKIGEATRLTKPKIVSSQLLLALNPFLLLEVVVNGHNDAVMMAFFLLALLYSLQGRLWPSLLALLASVGTKFMTILTLPLYFLKSPQTKVFLAFLILLFPVAVSLGRFQPWYLVWALIPAVLVDRLWVKTWVVLASLAGLIYYVPYIATGFWLNTLNFVIPIVYLPLIFSFLRGYNYSKKLAS